MWGTRLSGRYGDLAGAVGAALALCSRQCCRRRALTPGSSPDRHQVRARAEGCECLAMLWESDRSKRRGCRLGASSTIGRQ